MPRRIFDGLRRREPWLAEFCSAAVAICWGVLSLLTPGGIDRWTTMRILMELAPEEFWMMAPLCVGLAQMVALMFDDRWGRWCVAVAACWMWGVVTLAVWHSVPWAPTTVFVAGWAGLNAISILRLLRVKH